MSLVCKSCLARQSLRRPAFSRALGDGSDRGNHATSRVWRNTASSSRFSGRHDQRRDLAIVSTSRDVFTRVFPSLSFSSQQARGLFSAAILLKSKQHAGNSDRSASASGSHLEASNASDPFDLSQMQAAITRSHEKLKLELSKLKPGGRFNPEVLETLRVSVAGGGNGANAGGKKGAGGGGDKGYGATRETVKLGDIAQIVPRGRNIVVMVSDKDYVKPVTTAIQSSAYSLNPQPAPSSGATSALDASLELHVPIPATTQESLVAALKKAGEAKEQAHAEISKARQAHQKRLREMVLDSQRQKGKKGGGGTTTKAKGKKKGKARDADENDDDGGGGGGDGGQDLAGAKQKAVVITQDTMNKALQIMEAEAKKGVANATATVDRAKKVVESGSAAAGR